MTRGFWGLGNHERGIRVNQSTVFRYGYERVEREREGRGEIEKHPWKIVLHFGSASCLCSSE